MKTQAGPGACRSRRDTTIIAVRRNDATAFAAAP